MNEIAISTLLAEGEFHFTTDTEMDNIQSLTYFIDNLLYEDIPAAVTQQGTVARLDFAAMSYLLHSGGDGDFFSHVITVEDLYGKC